MKAKELADILLMHPDAEVVHYQYNGGCTPLITTNTVVMEFEGDETSSHDGGDFINNGIVQKDIIILTYGNL